MPRSAWLILWCILAVPTLIISCECSVRAGHLNAHRTWDLQVEKCFSAEMIGRNIKEATIFGRGLGEERQSDDISLNDLEEFVGDSKKPIFRAAGIYLDHPNCDRFPESCLDEGLVFGLDKQDRIVWVGRWIH